MLQEFIFLFSRSSEIKSYSRSRFLYVFQKLLCADKTSLVHDCELNKS